MNWKYLFIVLMLTLFNLINVFPTYASLITIKDGFEEKIIGEHIEFFTSDEKLSLKEVIEKNEFALSPTSILNFGLTTSDIWLKITVQNESSIPSFLLEVAFPMLDEVEYFYPGFNNEYSSILLNELFAEKRKYNTPDYVFDIGIAKGEIKTFYLRLKNTEQIILPIAIKVPSTFWEEVSTKNIINGIYIGIILIMFFYNLFVYFSTRDKSYLFYVTYVISVGLTHMKLQGYSLSYLFPNLTLDGSLLSIYGSLAGIAVVLFTQSFLDTKKNTKKLNYGLIVLNILFFVSLILVMLGYKHEGFKLTQMTSLIFSIYILILSYYLVSKGYKPARFFALSMSVLFVGMIIFLLKDFEILPYNNITNHSMQAATVMEMTLLSFALANRINIFRNEKEVAQQKVVEALQENEKIIREQNVILEQKVEERTSELNNTLTHLKETQSQLVDAEKMSSLGQLTAGIAHEINNPINFVSSNITPLRQDLDDLNTLLTKYEEVVEKSDLPQKKEEIAALKKELDYDYLKTELYSIIDGIEDGAKRTTEIVSGLRNFSRLDEGEMKNIDINEGVESTFVLIKNKLDGIKVVKNLGDLPTCECNAGKINQLIMNLLDNAIYAIEKKDIDRQEGLITISTASDGESITLAVKDNGIGIPDDIKDKLFDPFFTTKDVGEGTGLGLSIVRSIIDAHNGKMTVNSELNVGTEMIFSMPIRTNTIN